MIEPLKPDQIQVAKNADLPDFVISAVNEMLVKKWTGHQARFTQREIIGLILSKGDNVTRELLFENHWLDFEDIYRRQGWKVEYDSPGYNESYEANFTFTK